MRQRGLTLTKLDTDMVRLSGQLMPAVGAQLEKILSAFLNPKTAPKFELNDDISDDRNADRRNPDPRSRAQQAPQPESRFPGTSLLSLRTAD